MPTRLPAWSTSATERGARRPRHLVPQRQRDGVPVAAALANWTLSTYSTPTGWSPSTTFWYRLLNCGIILPASTGSDWYICFQQSGVRAFSGQLCLPGLAGRPARRGHVHHQRSPRCSWAADGHNPGNPWTEGSPRREVPVPRVGSRNCRSTVSSWSRTDGPWLGGKALGGCEKAHSEADSDRRRR